MAGTIKEINARTENSSYTIKIGNDIFLNSIDIVNEKSHDLIAIIVSANVYKLHKDTIDEYVKGLLNSQLYFMNDGEENKNYKYAESFLEQFIKQGLTRKSLVIGIGGGVVGDFAGYLAALYMRGIAIIHIPTTLLAMIDSSIGGKVAVNLNVGKNIIGAFHQPSLVISDTAFLKTLPEHEFTNGLTESFKHGLIGDHDTFNLFKKYDLVAFREDDSILQLLIYYSVLFKTTVVEKDEKEGGLRAILNYGHTVGHAIESLLEYSNISHGEAVAFGMKVKNEIAHKLGMLTGDDVILIDTIIEKCQLLHSELSLNVDEVIEHMVYDKKNTDNKINFVLLKGIGNPQINQQIDKTLLIESLKIYIG